ncbi:MAG: cysteine--tRNA ligase [Acidothermus sp.]|nr:cysteine--tRNA ligase [Acidothermus sp.]
MPLRLHDTLSRSVREFVPLHPPQVTIYVCGATVQAPPHIGHLRSALVFDILVRWLRAHGYDVVFCRNVTDIDDKILAVATEEGIPWWQVSHRNYRLFDAAYRLLGCVAPTVEPWATGHIPQIVALIRRLLDGGHAYVAGGDVYFSVRSYPEYGALSGADPDAVQEGDALHKRDPRDFALWKGVKPGEPAWDTPWGPGRPGWHIECSAMAGTYLGPTFDIHGGGRDLLFPHHENERAQSRAAGDEFARYWLHNGLVTLRGEKMSKSLGNVLSTDHLLSRVRAIELRYYLVAAHYRSTLDFSEEALDEAAAAYRRVENFFTRAHELVGEPAESAPLPSEFVAAMDDDLGVPQALAVLHSVVRSGNTALAEGDKAAVQARLAEVTAMLDVLGLRPPADGGDVSRLRRVLDGLVETLLAEREAARARKDYATADSLRQRLTELGVVVEDTPSGPRWQVRLDT